MGLNPTRGEINILQVRNYFFLLLVAVRPIVVPVAQLDKASDYESEDWGFKSLQGYETSLHGLMDKAHPS